MKAIYFFLFVILLFNKTIAQDTLDKYYNAFPSLTPFDTKEGLVPAKSIDGLKLMIIKVASIDTNLKISYNCWPMDSVYLLNNLRYVAKDSVLYDSSGRLIYAYEQGYAYTSQGIETSLPKIPHSQPIKYYINHSDVVKIAWENGAEYIRYSKNHYPKKVIYWIKNKKHIDRYWVHQGNNTIQIKRRSGNNGLISEYTFLRDDGQLISQKGYSDPSATYNMINSFYFEPKHNKYFITKSLSYFEDMNIPKLSESNIYKYINIQENLYLSEIATYYGELNICHYKTKIIYDEHAKPIYEILEIFCDGKSHGGSIIKYEYYYW